MVTSFFKHITLLPYYYRFATVGYPKVPFLLATYNEMLVGNTTYFAGIATLTLDLYLIMLSVKLRGMKYNFLVFNSTRPRIERRSPRLLRNY